MNAFLVCLAGKNASSPAGMTSNVAYLASPWPCALNLPLCPVKSPAGITGLVARIAKQRC